MGKKSSKKHHPKTKKSQVYPNIPKYNSDAEIKNLSDAETVKMSAQRCAATSKKNN